MYEAGILPRSFRELFFFTVGLRFALRGVQEQHDLKLDQLKRNPPNIAEYSGDTYYEYTEFFPRTISIALRTSTLSTSQ